VAHSNLGLALQDQGKLDEAVAEFRRALEIKPDPGIEFKIAMLLLPAIPSSMEALLSARQAFEERIEALGRKGLSLDNPYKQVGTTNFYLAYHGMNDRELQQAIARLYLKACPSLAWTAPHCTNQPRREAKSKIKVGFISAYFWQHSVGTVTNGIIANLPRDSLSITMFFAQTKWDESSAFAERHADKAIKVPLNLAAAREVIAEEELDILVYTDIGMDPFTYFLAFSRLAPVQCTMHGHPVTTGIPTIDYFISSEFLEIDDSDEQYSETLVRLKGLPYYYSRPSLPAVPKNKADLGLPETGTLYVCPMMLFKIHPSFDEAVAAILRRDPSAKFILFQDKRTLALHEALLARYRKTMPDVTDRIIFLPFASKEDFLSILMQCDVALDNFGLSGGTTVLQILATGLPIVTKPSQTSRGRWTYTFYKTMDLMDCVASSLDEYVDLAVRLGTDQVFHDRIKSKILKRNGAVFENPEMLDAMAAFFNNPSVFDRKT
jgi:predicted O-linked N-acetylglucosamine transferase (SPINDLY family)